MLIIIVYKIRALAVNSQSSAKHVIKNKFLDTSPKGSVWHMYECQFACEIQHTESYSGIGKNLFIII